MSPRDVTPGPFSVVTLKAGDGTPNAGVKSDSVGVCVCWCHGRTEAEAHANAEHITKLLTDAWRATQ